MPARIQTEIDALIAEVNTHAAGLSWLDFEVQRYEPPTLVVSASTDAASWSDLRLAFRDVHRVCLRFDGWSCETGRPVLRRLEGEEAEHLAKAFHLDVGYHLFGFTAPENCGPLWIAARHITADLRRIEVLDEGNG
jgi:hypothetical protein